MPEHPIKDDNTTLSRYNLRATIIALRKNNVEPKFIVTNKVFYDWGDKFKGDKDA